MARVESDSSGSDSDDNEEKLLEEQEPIDGDKDDSSDDESITSEEEIDLTNMEERVSALEEKILDNPYDFQKHVDLLAILTQIGGRNRVRGAYERLRDSFPLEPSQWLSWLQLEGDSVTTEEGRANIYSLFQKAFQDCFCGGIYMELCAMSMSDEGETRKVLSEALEAAGPDPLDGSLLWDTAKEFELNRLAVIGIESTASDEYREQVERVMSIYTNQLCRPLFRAEGVLEEFREFVTAKKESIVDAEERVAKIEEAHQASELILKSLMEFEYQLESIGGNTEEKIHERCSVYDKYLHYSKQLLVDIAEPNLHNLKSLINVLYDRATSDCSAALCRILPELTKDVEDICVDYVDFITSYGSSTECLGIIERNIRRCPRNSRLWVKKIRQLERMEVSLEQIKDAFEGALFSGFQTAEDYVTIWMCYLEVLKRQTDFSSEDQVDRMRNTFRLAWDTLGQMWGDAADTEFSILQFWARLEYHHTKDYKYGRELFEEILDYPENRVRGGLWMEYINLEKISGGVSRARTCYKRAVKNSGDPRLRWAWLCMERDHGTLDTLIECEIICAEKAKEWEKQQQIIRENKMAAGGGQKNFNKNSKKGENEPGTSYSKQNRNKGKKDNAQQGGSRFNKSTASQPPRQENKKRNQESRKEWGKRKIDAADELSSSPAKLARNGGDSTIKNKSNGEHSSTGASPKRKTDGEESASKRLKSNTTDVSMGPPPGFVRGAQDSDTNSTGSSSRDQYHTYDDSDTEKNGRTIFVSNLDKVVDEDDVKNKLNSYGEVEEFRFSRGPYGRICYCVYTDISSRDMALSRDRSPVGGRPMFMSQYNSSKETRRKHFTYQTTIERNKLFVKNIPFEHCTKEALTALFQKYGELKDIRIVTHRNGKPKGLAYIEYSEDKSASAALQSTDGYDLDGRLLNVALSAPPPKKKEPSQLGTVVPTPPSTSRGHAKTMLFIPSAVTQKALTKASLSSETSGSTEASTSSKLSNSDFRNMLLNKK